MDVYAVDPLITTVFGLSCFASGITAGLLLHRRQRDEDVNPEPASRWLDPELDDYLAERSRAWAQARGTPYLKHLAHHRLRTAARLAGYGEPQEGGQH